ncbi:MAG TPA: hypothetical protein VJB93_00015 [Patescibacteria group bacterium]|nr:hypothetical protein [Patescibacteria group bacterium]
MKHIRIYGKAPFGVAILHGGPGATGEMRPVAEELSQNFRFILLNHCGHTPWLEEEAQDRFYEILKAEISLVN